MQVDNPLVRESRRVNIRLSLDLSQRPLESFHRMDWDKISIARHFMQHANAIHPDEIDDPAGRSEARARQDLYYDCYMSSFSRDALLKRLDDVLGGAFELPDEAGIDHDRYCDAYVREAGVVIAAVNRGEIK